MAWYKCLYDGVSTTRTPQVLQNVLNILTTCAYLLTYLQVPQNVVNILTTCAVAPSIFAFLLVIQLALQEFGYDPLEGK